MKRLYILLTAVTVASASAQDLKKVTGKFYPNPQEMEINTPLSEKRSGYTSYKEMIRFLAEKGNHELINVVTVGKTQRDKDIVMVKISSGDETDQKMRLLYIARIHGDEPGGTEGLLHFIDRMGRESDLQRLLDKLDIYILPMVNVDGGENLSRRTANGIDLNRDQVRLETPEAQVLREVVNNIDPHLYVDFHEYQPLKSAYSLISPEVLSVPWDVMFLTSSNPNVADIIRHNVDSVFLPDSYKSLADHGFSHHTYYTPKTTDNGVVLNMGGSSPRSTSSSFALNGGYSVLIEARGIGLGRKTIKRRVEQVNILAESFARTCHDKKESLMAGLTEAAAERKDVALRFSSEKISDCPVPFLNQLKNRIDTVEVNVSNALNQEVKLSRQLADKYYLLPTEKRAVETLRKLGIIVETLDKQTTLELEAYTVTSAIEETTGFATFTPLSVDTKISKRMVTLPEGSFVVSTGQNRFRLLSVLMEPESSNGFVNYRIITAKKGEELPCYRSGNR